MYLNYSHKLTRMDDKKITQAENKRLCTIAISLELHEAVKKEAKKTRRTVGVTATLLIEEGLALRS